MNEPQHSDEQTTKKATSRCSHRDMAGDSAIEAINDHTWCTICGAAGPELDRDAARGRA